jgi:hypothetical protein
MRSMSSSYSSRTRTRRYREALRRRGLRPVQIWVPDIHAPGFAENIREQCRRINELDEAEGVMDWIERVSLFDNQDHP